MNNECLRGEQSGEENILADIFDYFQPNLPGFLYSNAVLQRYRQLARRLALLPGAFGLFRREGVNRFVFVGSKYRQLIKDLAGERVALVGGVRQLAVALKNGYGFVSDRGMYRFLVKSYEGQRVDPLEAITCRCRSVLEMYRPEVLVTVNDSLPRERVWIRAARQLGIPSVCIQHGLFMPGNPINDGRFADVMAVYDRHQAQVVLGTGARRGWVFGFFEDVAQLPPPKYPGRVCILGQPWVEHYGARGGWYVEELAEVTEILQTAGVCWRYKPHPSEVMGRGLSPVPNAYIFAKPLGSAFRDFSAFISWTSTALLEATLHGRTGVQIISDSLSSDCFENHGYAYSVHRRELKELPAAITNEPLATHEIDQRPLIERFEILMESLR